MCFHPPKPLVKVKRQKMNNQQLEEQQWAECPEGQFSQLASALRKRSPRRRFLVVSAVATAGSLAGLGLWTRTQSDDTPAVQGAFPVPSYDYGGITCEAVKENIDLYVLQQCTPEISRQIDSHIQQCLSCKHLIDQTSITISS